MDTVARDSAFQYDSILETELSWKWISLFRTRVRDRFYESKVVKLISIHPVQCGGTESYLSMTRARCRVETIQNE